MGFLSTFLGIIGCGIGFPIGLFIGFYFFIYSMPHGVQDPKIRPLFELETDILQNLISEIPLWVKNPDYDRVDWLNQFILEMWPFLDKAICSIIRSTCEPMFAEYIEKYMVEKIDFENLTLGTHPPTIQGLKVYETNEKELVLEPSIKWAGNADVVVSIVLLSARIRLQLVDLQFFVLPRVTLKPLVPTFPCFTNIVVSLMEKPHVDFGFKVLGGDFMAIPGLYRFIQETIKKQVTKLYHWPQTLDIPILSPTSVTMKKPVGILHVKVVRAAKLLKRDLLGLSDPYVKIRLSGDRFPAKKTSIKKKTLNPEWNETFNLTVKDPQTQLLNLDVFDWDKVGAHDKLGKQIFPLKNLKPNETKEVTLDLLKSTDLDTDLDKKTKLQQRGRLVVELTYAPFREGSEGFSGHFGSFNGEGPSSSDANSTTRSAGLLLVTIIGAQDVEGSRHNNPFVEIFFRGEKRKSKMMRKARDPQWDEDFQFMVEEPPMNEKIHLQVKSKKKVFGFRFFKESLGHVDINLDDVIHNGRINEKYHLIDSKNGIIHVELGWKTI